MTLRIATIPDDHPYVDAVIPTGVERVRFPSAGVWDPSPLLEPATARRALPGIDLVHVHFGFESLTLAQLTEWLAELRAAGTALAVTVHDLRLPHQLDPARHSAHLTALLAAADVVFTLTPGAAAEIGRRWSRDAIVLAHPSLLGDDEQAVPNGSNAIVGLHLKSLRTNVVDPAALVTAAAAGAARAGGSLRVDLHPDAVGSAAGQDVVTAAAAAGAALAVHPRFTDTALHEYLAGLAVSVLPYRFGTHSGWLELCRDLGVAVVAPDCGYYREQWTGVVQFGHNERDGLAPAELADAVAEALRRGRPTPADRAERAAQRDQVRAAHLAGYAHAVGRPG